MRILIFAYLVCLGSIIACDRATILEPKETGRVDFWNLNGVNYYGEPEHWDAHAKNDEGGKCWHWTMIDGRWYARTCGLTLSEECYTPCGPYGAVCECSEGGPGGDW